MPEYERYLKIKRTINLWLEGKGSITDISKRVSINSKSLQEILTRQGLLDPDFTPSEGTTEQDVWNCLFFVLIQVIRKTLRKR